MQVATPLSTAHALGAFCSSVTPEAGLKKSGGNFFKEVQAAPLHERGHAATSDKMNRRKELKMIHIIWPLKRQIKQVLKHIIIIMISCLSKNYLLK
jgi:hypothetical protein